MRLRRPIPRRIVSTIRNGSNRPILKHTLGDLLAIGAFRSRMNCAITAHPSFIQRHTERCCFFQLVVQRDAGDAVCKLQASAHVGIARSSCSHSRRAECCGPLPLKTGGHMRRRVVYVTAGMGVGSARRFLSVCAVNLTGLFNMTKQVIDGMVERGCGRIIDISSMNGQKGQLGQTDYCAAKAGIHGLTMALAQEVATRRVTVNTISPGYIGTDMYVRSSPKCSTSSSAVFPSNVSARRRRTHRWLHGSPRMNRRSQPERISP